MIRSVKLATLLSVCASLVIGTMIPAGATSAQQNLCNVNLNSGFSVPHDLAASASLTDLECFAWQSFIALNWPAVTQNNQPNTRGVPDQTQTFAASGNNGFYGSGGRLVWETYKHKVELFPGSGAPSSSYDSGPQYTYAVKVNVPSGVSAKLFNNLDEGTQIGQNYIFFPKNPPRPSYTGTKITPNNDYQILFEAKTNRVAYNYVVSNKYYNPTTAATAATNTVAYLSNPSQPPKSPYISYPQGDMTQSGSQYEGAIETKAAWRMLTQAEIASGRYHTATVVYYTGSDSAPVANNATFGLIALHIIHKTKNYPYFIFATFEQVDALNLSGGTNPTGLYLITTYPSVSYLDNNGKPTQPPPPPPTFPNGKLFAAPGLPTGFAGPTTVAQYTPVQAVTSQVNASVHQQIVAQNSNSVWQYYNLLGVQSFPTNDQQSAYFYLANVVVESSLPGLQRFQGRIPPPPFPNGFPASRSQPNTFLLSGTSSSMVDMGGCMGCHAVPQRTGYDFSFILKGGPVNNPDAIGLPSPTSTSLRALRVARQFRSKK